PPPPLPLGGHDAGYRPAFRGTSYHRDYYMRLDFPADPRDGSKAHSEDCRVRSVDGALANGAWELLAGPKDTMVEIEFERPDGRLSRRSFRRTVPVVERKHFAPTTQ